MKPERARKKGQHLVELMLFFPFFVAILGILLELALAFYSNYKLNVIMYEAIDSVWLEPKTSITKEAVALSIQDSAQDIMRNNLVPYANTLGVQIVDVDNTSAVIASYRYRAVFTLVNLFFPVFPEQLHFNIVVPVNSSILSPNTFSLDDARLKGIFSSLSQEEEGGEGE